VRDTLDTIRKVFPLRTCSDPVFKNRSRPCIEYDIKRCLGPCVLPVDRAVYEEHLRQAMLLLEGRNREVTGLCANGWRPPRRRSVRGGGAPPRPDPGGRDHAGAPADHRPLGRRPGRLRALSRGRLDRGAGAVRPARHDGRHDRVRVRRLRAPDEEVLEAVLTQFYQATDRDVPDEILLPVAIGDAAVRAEYLSERRGKKVTVLVRSAVESSGWSRWRARTRSRASPRGARRRRKGRGRSPSCSGSSGSACRRTTSNASTSRRSRAASRSARSWRSSAALRGRTATGATGSARSSARTTSRRSRR
jgi:hypothetical protein